MTKLAGVADPPGTRPVCFIAFSLAVFSRVEKLGLLVRLVLVMIRHHWCHLPQYGNNLGHKYMLLVSRYHPFPSSLAANGGRKLRRHPRYREAPPRFPPSAWHPRWVAFKCTLHQTGPDILRVRPDNELVSFSYLLLGCQTAQTPDQRRWLASHSRY